MVHSLPDLFGPGLRDVRTTSCSGRDSDVSLELPWHRITILNTATLNLYTVCSHLQVDVLGFSVFWDCDRGNNISGWCVFAFGKFARLVSEDKSDAVVFVFATASASPIRGHE